MKTKRVLREIGVASYWPIYNLIRSGKIQPPAKDEDGRFVWSARDVKNVKKALAAKVAKRAA